MSKTSHDLLLEPHAFSLLTNHTHVIVLIAQRPDVRMREIATTVGITERAVQRIVDDLTSTGFIIVTKDGRRNRYEIQPDSPLRHPLDKHRTVGDLIRLLVPEYRGGSTEPGGTGIGDRFRIPSVDTLANDSDGPMFSMQACDELLDALDGPPAVMAHGAELRSSEK